MEIDWKMTAAAGLIALKVAQYALGLILINWPSAPNWVKVLKTALDDVLPNPSLPQVRALLKREPAPTVGPLPPVAKVAVILAMLMSGVAHAQVVWDQPIFYAGPTVAPIEEISAKNPTPAVAAGFQQTLGLGQYEMLEHSWDVVDLSLLELGGLALPGAGPAGQLQLGVKIGTLNGLVGLGILFDCLDSAGTGLCQGGNQGGPIWAGMFDIQALVTWFGSGSSSEYSRLTLRAPRGGL